MQLRNWEKNRILCKGSVSVATYICQLKTETQQAIRNELKKLGLFKDEIEYAMTFKVDDLDELINVTELLNK